MLTPHEREQRGATTVDVLKGIVFAFDTSLTLEKIGEHMVELNKEYKSDLWPDSVVVVDKGLLTYGIQNPGGGAQAGWLMTIAMPKEADFLPPAWFVNLCIFPDRDLTLNRFFLDLLLHAELFPVKSGVPPFKSILDSEKSLAKTVSGYQYNLARELRPVPEELYIKDGKGPTVDTGWDIYTTGGRALAQLQYMPWQDGGVVRFTGNRRAIEACLSAVRVPTKTLLVEDTTNVGMALTTIMPLSKEQFLKWRQRIEQQTEFVARPSVFPKTS